MTVSLCPLCQSPLFALDTEVLCMAEKCRFVADFPPVVMIAAALAHHMRPLAEPHAYRENPDYPGQCDEPVGDPVVPCNRPKECHR